MPDLFQIIYEDDDLLVINKPAGLVCHPTRGDIYSSLISRIRLHLGIEARAGSGLLEAHLINRLDRETSGVVLAAKNRASAAELRRSWESRAVEKVYLAIVHGEVREETGTIDAPLGKDSASPVAIKDSVRADGAPACTRFRVMDRFRREGRAFSLVMAFPETGRKHQIRIHLAHAGHPIVGDKIYGGDENLYLAFIAGRVSPEQEERLILPFHALHAQRLRFGWREREWRFEAEPESWFREFLGASKGIG